MFTFSASTSRPPQNLGLSRRVDILWDISWFSTVWYSGSSIDMHHGRYIWKINGGVTLIRVDIEGFWLFLSVWSQVCTFVCVCVLFYLLAWPSAWFREHPKREKILEMEVPEMGVPPNHLFIDGFSIINYPATGMGVFPWLWTPHWCSINVQLISP